MTLDNWLNYIEKHLFHLKDDFFQIPFLFNSPSRMLSSLLELPIAKHNSLKQSISLESTYYKTEIHYREIEEGFWIIMSDVNVMENVVTKLGFDENIFSEYYLLTFSLFENEISFKGSEKVRLLSPYWTFSKPNTEISTYFHKGTTAKVFSFAFKKDWANKNFTSKNLKERKAIIKFLDGKRGFYSWLDIAPKAHETGAELSKFFEQGYVLETDKPDLKKKSLKLVMEFFYNSFNDSRIKDSVSLSNLDYHNIAKAEKIIIHNLHNQFVGIEMIAKEVNTSPTKLKSDFKIVFGLSMLQYHKEKNMLLAMQLIQNSNIHIKHIALLTGYDSAGRFTANFKKRFGKLPSEMRFSQNVFL